MVGANIDYCWCERVFLFVFWFAFDDRASNGDEKKALDREYAIMFRRIQLL